MWIITGNCVTDCSYTARLLSHTALQYQQPYFWRRLNCGNEWYYHVPTCTVTNIQKSSLSKWSNEWFMYKFRMDHLLWIHLLKVPVSTYFVVNSARLTISKLIKVDMNTRNTFGLQANVLMCQVLRCELCVVYVLTVCETHKSTTFSFLLFIISKQRRFLGVARGGGHGPQATAPCEGSTTILLTKT